MYGGAHFCIPRTAIRPAPSSSDHANAYLRCSLPRVLCYGRVGIIRRVYVFVVFLYIVTQYYVLQDAEYDVKVVKTMGYSTFLLFVFLCRLLSEETPFSVPQRKEVCCFGMGAELQVAKATHNLQLHTALARTLISFSL